MVLKFPVRDAIQNVIPSYNGRIMEKPLFELSPVEMPEYIRKEMLPGVLPDELMKRASEIFDFPMLAKIFDITEQQLNSILVAVLPLIPLIEQPPAMFPIMRLRELLEFEMLENLLTLPEEVLYTVIDAAKQLKLTGLDTKVAIKQLSTLPATKLVGVVDEIKGAFKNSVGLPEGGAIDQATNVMMDALLELIMIVEQITMLETIMIEKLRMPIPMRLSYKQMLNIFKTAEGIPLNVEDSIETATDGFLGKKEELLDLGGQVFADGALIPNIAGDLARWMEQIVVSLASAKKDIVVTSADLTFELANFVVGDLVMNNVINTKEAALRLVDTFGDGVFNLLDNALFPIVNKIPGAGPILTDTLSEIRFQIANIVQLFARYQEILGTNLLTIKEFANPQSLAFKREEEACDCLSQEIQSGDCQCAAEDYIARGNKFRRYGRYSRMK